MARQQPIRARYVATWIRVRVAGSRFTRWHSRTARPFKRTDAFAVHKTKRHESTATNSIGLRACATLHLSSTAHLFLTRFSLSRIDHVRTDPFVTAWLSRRPLRFQRASGIAHHRNSREFPPRRAPRMEGATNVCIADHIPAAAVPAVYRRLGITRREHIT